MTNRKPDRESELPVLLPGQSYDSITRHISDITLGRPTLGWWIGFGISCALLVVLIISIGYLFYAGVGIWGINRSVVWGYAITNYVWWIGIGNAGTLISAMLYLTRQEWRTSINRFAEAMTLFAVAIAGLFPILHLGRPYLFYWLMPYPNVMEVWPQSRSPLVWDFFAILSYLIVSLLFWYAGLIPDLATIRDRASSRTKQVIYGVLALGWRGSARHWQRHERVYLLLAALAVPLVVSVHSVVGYEFSVGLLPSWSETIFAPYFVIGAMFSGFAMVITLTILLRAAFRLHAFVTLRHLDNMARILVAGSLLMGYSYGIEIFMAWYSGDPIAWEAVMHKFSGPYSPIYWSMILCNVVVPQLLWFKTIRRTVVILFLISIMINIGMWLERLEIIVDALSHGYLPSAWEMYYPTFWDWALLLGTFGLFSTLFFVFARFVPLVPMHEMRKLIKEKEGEIP